MIFLIESEVQRHCDDVYAPDVLHTHSKQIEGHFAGLSNAEGYKVLINGLLSAALTKVYSEYPVDQNSLRGLSVFTEGIIKLPNQDEVLNLLVKLKGKNNLSPEEYKNSLSEIIELLTGIKIQFTEEGAVIKNPEELKKFIQEINDHFDGLKNMLRMASESRS